MSKALTAIKTLFVIALTVCLILLAILVIQLIPQTRITSLVKIPQKQQSQKPTYEMPTVTYQTDAAKDTTYQISLVRPSGFPPAIQQKVDAFYNTAKTSLLTAAAIPQDPALREPFVYTMTSEKPLVTNAGPYVFIIAQIAEYTGGAHGNVAYFQVAYDVRTRQEVTLPQFFKDPTTAYQVIANIVAPVAVDQVIKKSTEGQNPADITEEQKTSISAMAYQGLAPLSENFQYWYFTKDGKLVFVFPPYQIGPWALGVQTVAVPLASMQESLNLQMFK